MNETFVMDSVSHTLETHCYRTASGSDRMLAFNKHSVVSVLRT